MNMTFWKSHHNGCCQYYVCSMCLRVQVLIEARQRAMKIIIKAQRERQRAVQRYSSVMTALLSSPPGQARSILPNKQPSLHNVVLCVYFV